MLLTLSPQEFVDKWRKATLKERSAAQEYFMSAYRKLDQAVLDAYGWPHDLSDEEILEPLLGLNLEQAEAEGGE